MSGVYDAEAFLALRASWPGVELTRAAFEQHLARVGNSEPARAAELYLCCACGEGDARAHAHFQKTYSIYLRQGAARVRKDEDFVREVAQCVHDKLFVADPPGIWKYTGRGPLETWLRVVASRVALDQVRSERRRQAIGGEFPQAIAALDSGLETKLDRARYLQAFQDAVHAAIASLSARERNVLRLHYVAGINIEGIGKAYRVHRATVARWIARIRSHLLERVRADLSARVQGLSDSEFEGLVALVHTRLDLAVSSWMSGSGGVSSDLQEADECPQSA
jgi:RNA polymerase sigma-70 factor (ECF subfamily)